MADYLRTEFHLPGRKAWPEQVRAVRFWDIDRFADVLGFPVDPHMRLESLGVRDVVHLSPKPTDDEMLRFVEDWIDQLAQGQFEVAFRSTAHDPYYQWSPELVRLVIEGYGLPEPHPSGVVFRVTPRGASRGGPPTRQLVRYDAAQPPFCEVRYDLPLNGEWSDLTATFRVDSGTDGSTVALQEIHVF